MEIWLRRDDHAPGLHLRRPLPLQQHVSEAQGSRSLRSAARGQPRGAVGRVGAARGRWPVTLAEARRSGGAGETPSWAGHPAPAPRPGLTAEGGPGTGAVLVKLYPSEVTLLCSGPLQQVVVCAWWLL